MAAGLKIKALREKRGWTLEDLSIKSGVDVGTIHALERRDSARSRYFPAIARAFGLSVEGLCDGPMPNGDDFEEPIEKAVSRRNRQSDQWFREAEAMLLAMTPIQRAQMVANMRSFRQYLDQSAK